MQEKLDDISITSSEGYIVMLSYVKFQFRAPVRIGATKVKAQTKQHTMDHIYAVQDAAATISDGSGKLGSTGAPPCCANRSGIKPQEHDAFCNRMLLLSGQSSNQ